MEFWQALILGVVEGLTEFLPVSSTGHLTITEELLGLPVDDPGVTAFTAVIQVGAILAVIAYFRTDITRLAAAWFRGMVDPAARATFDYRCAWYVIAGSIPIGVVGFLGKDLISGSLRSLWVVAAALIGWSAVMAFAERTATQRRDEGALRLADVLIIGFAQCIALVPGVSRSGATISVGLLRGLDRVAATRLSFFLSIPALAAAGAYEGITEAGAVSATVGWAPTVVGAAVSLGVAYVSIAWLLRLVAHHRITVFVGYRVTLGVGLAVALATGAMSAT